MPNSLELRLGGSAPFALHASAVASGGADWIAGAASFAVGAWDSPDEHDFDALRILNTRDSGAGSDHSGVNVNELGAWNVTLASSSVVTLSWQPPRRQPHHYSVYYMPYAAFDRFGLALARKVLPDGLSAIPGNATGCELRSGLGVSQRRVAPVLHVSSADGAISLPGWRGLSFFADPAGSIVTLRNVPGWADGPQRVSAVRREFTIEGEVTALVLDGWVGGPDSRGGTCEYDLGPLCLDTLHMRPAVPLSLEHLLELSPRRLSAPGIDGCETPLSHASGTLHERLGFELEYGGLKAGGLHLLNKYAHDCREVEVTDVNDSGSPYLRQWRGVLEAPSSHGGVKRQGDTLRFGVRIHAERRMSGERSGLAVRAVASGTPGAFVVDGDETSRLTPGRALHVVGSSGNDRPYAVAPAGPTYDAALHRTTIPVSTTVPSGTADGFIEVYEW